MRTVLLLVGFSSVSLMALGSGADGQTTAEAEALADAVGTALAHEPGGVLELEALGSTVAGDSWQSPEAAALLRAIERAAGATRAASGAMKPLPRCPWGTHGSGQGTGFRVGIWRPDIRGGRAMVATRFACQNPAEYHHRVFVRDEVWHFGRDAEGAWQLRERQVMQIT